MEKWEIAIEKLKVLFKERSAPEFWSTNIIEAHEGLTEKRDCAMFYRFLTSNRGRFDPNEAICTIDDIVNLKPIDPYPEGLEAVIYQNGPEHQIIHVKNVMLDHKVASLMLDDEKCPQ